MAATATEKRVALVKCCGTRSEAIRVGDYNGICDCATAAMTAATASLPRLKIGRKMEKSTNRIPIV